ncbi:MAG TPA: thiol-disulfide oxidoreductase DCC family protein [Pyrinomonadaceae bacterium]|jgi:predicted DCC family thiol-disulfide oxidoreductase YuxK
MDRVVLFDGVCNFCNGAVNWIIAHDPEAKFKFAPLQSEFGDSQRRKFGIPRDVDSIILIENDRAFIYSSAALRVLKTLGGIWSLGYIAIIVPEPIRDWFYKWFSRNRYRWFGKQDTCMIPTPAVRERFVS